MQTKFGDRLRAMRLERGLSQSRLARAAEITQGTLSRAEDGVRPLSPNVVDRLALAFGTEPWELVRATDAEGKYVAARLDAAAVATRKANDDALACELLFGLLTVYGRLFRFCRAVWSHGVCLGDPRHEAMREVLADLCQVWFPRLERLGYVDVRERVEIPPAILDDADVMPGAEGEEWEFVWEPMLVRGERWIVVNLARVGGRPTEEALEALGFAKFAATMEEWDALIAGIDRANARYYARVLAAVQGTFAAGETADHRESA
jgi:transcriptional regulator with XRE-family HTH domain